MYIQLTSDYNANDNKGLYATISNVDGDEHDEADLFLFRIENEHIIMYDSPNGVAIAKADGVEMGAKNVKLVSNWLLDFFPNSDIDSRL